MKVKDLLRCELARREFYSYCQTLYPEFYTSNRPFLQELCNTLEGFLYDDSEFMIINAPPRHGKSFTATNFVEWALGKFPTLKIISGSYNEDLSKTFSKKVRDTITMDKIGERIVYNDIFPDTTIKAGSAEVKKWQIEKSPQINYLATSPTGTATGFGAELEVIDDLIKSDKDANNDTVLEGHWNWFVNTMLSRREGRRKVLIIMTRWRTKDLAGRLMEYLDDEGIPYRHINFKAKREDGSMLCADIFNEKDYDNARKIMGDATFLANYQQETIDLQGVLYSNLMEWDKLPDNYQAIENYTDVADAGADYLCAINYMVAEGNAYITDILYTQEPTEVTEGQLAKMITDGNVNWARIESNNGGKIFSRNVARLARDKFGNKRTMFKPFHQSSNKQARILTGATGVMNNVYFPKDWRKKYPEFYKAMTTYQRIAKNAHDDAPDATTGVFEILEKHYLKKRLAKGRL